MENQASRKLSENGFDVLRYFLLVRRFWYIIVLCVCAALIYAYYQNKYTPRVYRVSMSLIINANQGEGNSAAMLFNNSLLKQSSNFYNDPYLLKADPLVDHVVKKLKLTTSYYLQGDIKTTEVYPGLPVSISPDTTSTSTLPYGSSYWIKVVNSRSFLLKPYIESDPSFDSKLHLYEFGQIFDLSGQKIRIERNSDFIVSSFYQQPFVLQFKSPAELVTTYTNSLSIGWAEQGAGILNLSIVGQVPAKEIHFLRTLAQTYIYQDLVKKNQNAANTINFINEQLEHIGDSLNLIERRLQNFKQEHLGVALGEQASTLFSSLQTLEQKKNQSILQERYFEYITNYIQQGLETAELVAPSSVEVSDPVLNSLINQLINLQLRKEELKRGTQAIDNPYLLGFNEQIADIKRNILENIVSQQGNLKISRQSLNREIARMEGDIRQLPRAEREFINIQRVYKLSESLYNYLLQKRAEASISRASTTSDISIVNPPKQVSGAITPDVRGNYIKSLVLGFGAPLALLFLLYYINTKVQLKEDLEKFTRIPFLGVVGHNHFDTNLVVVQKPKSAVAESFRGMRSNLNFFTAGIEGPKVFLLTSSISGEGKTFCSINLASVFAFSGVKTILIGADMRKPKIFQDFGLTNTLGLSNYLAGAAPLTAVIQTTSIQNLHIISGGIIPPNPSELLMSKRMDEALNILKTDYEVVIIDSPPLGLVTDSQVLMPFAHHTIFVVRQNHTHVQMLKNIQEAYEDGKVTNVSLLFNDLKSSKSGYGYGYGYGYYDDEKQERKGLIGRVLQKFKR